MRFEKVFRFSVYLTLAIASAGLCSAERYFIPEINFFLIPALALLVTAYVVEGRWVLTPVASNIFGVIIATGAALWVARSLAAPTNQLIENAPYPAAFLPFGGPILILVMLAKLFRPKQINDYWGLHIIGLMEMALACILGGDPEFSFWLFAYAASALWSLMLFSRYRDTLRSDTADALATSAQSVLGPLRLWGTWFTAKRVVLIVALTFLFFLLTPRHSNERWNLLNPAATASQVETGFAPHIDFTQTGKVNVSEEVALELRVKDAEGKPKTDLNPAQRWRGTTLHYYENGRWQPRHTGRIPTVTSPGFEIPSGPDAGLPELGPDAYSISYDVDLFSSGLVIAEPVVQSADSKWSVRVLGDDPNWVPFYHTRDKILLLPAGRPHARTIRYQQVLPGEHATDALPVVGVSDQYVSVLARQPVDNIRTWTNGVLKRLVAKGQLDADDLATTANPLFGANVYVLPENRGKVAQALCHYLITSGEFLYRLELRRSDLAADPVDDFLRNVKQGFCAHFSSGLTLMLRSVGIPARVVTGFRGVEYFPDDSPDGAARYVIRKSHAHSWVEALLENPGRDGKTQYQWLMLDPTPADELNAGGDLTWDQWWAYLKSRLRDIWSGMILEYNTERQSATLTSAWKRVTSSIFLGAFGGWVGPDETSGATSAWTWAVAVPVFGLVGWWLWRKRRTRNGRSPIRPNGEYAFYTQWLGVIAHHTGGRPRPAQTPSEFAEHVMLTFPHRSVSHFINSVSRSVIALYYRVRYGGQTLEPEERRVVDERIAELDATLRAENS